MTKEQWIQLKEAYETRKKIEIIIERLKEIQEEITFPLGNVDEP